MQLNADKALEKKVHKFKERKQRVELLMKEIETLDKEIRQAMGEAETLLNARGDAVIATLTTQGGKGRLDVEALRQWHPKIYEQFLKTGKSYKVLRIK